MSKLWTEIPDAQLPHLVLPPQLSVIRITQIQHWSHLQQSLRRASFWKMLPIHRRPWRQEPPMLKLHDRVCRPNRLWRQNERKCYHPNKILNPTLRSKERSIKRMDPKCLLLLRPRNKPYELIALMHQLQAFLPGMWNLLSALVYQVHCLMIPLTCSIACGDVNRTCLIENVLDLPVMLVRTHSRFTLLTARS